MIITQFDSVMCHYNYDPNTSPHPPPCPNAHSPHCPRSFLLNIKTFHFWWLFLSFSEPICLFTLVTLLGPKGLTGTQTWIHKMDTHIIIIHCTRKSSCIWLLCEWSVLISSKFLQVNFVRSVWRHPVKTGCLVPPVLVSVVPVCVL